MRTELLQICVWINFSKASWLIWEKQDGEVDQEIDGKMRWERMEEAPANGKELSNFAHANGMNEILANINVWHREKEV